MLPTSISEVSVWVIVWPLADTPVIVIPDKALNIGVVPSDSTADIVAPTQLPLIADATVN